jgi:steroid Delta-isomerase
MVDMSSFDAHPARDVAIRSMTAVEAGDRETWLALFAEDAIIEDPIGPSPMNESGEPRRGITAIAAFYDSVIAGGEVRFDIRESFACGNEVANVGTITVAFPGGARSIVDGVYTYRIDDRGRLVALRAYWEFSRLTIEA